MRETHAAPGPPAALLQAQGTPGALGGGGLSAVLAPRLTPGPSPWGPPHPCSVRTPDQPGLWPVCAVGDSKGFGVQKPDPTACSLCVTLGSGHQHLKKSSRSVKSPAHALTPRTPISSKCRVKDLTLRHDTTKLPKETTGKTLPDRDCTDVSFGPSPKAVEIKAQISNGTQVDSSASAQQGKL